MKKEFETNDMSIAAVFLSLQIDMIRIDVLWNIATFIFMNKERCQKLVDNYYNWKLLVNPLAYTNHSRNLKSRLHKLFKHGH